MGRVPMRDLDLDLDEILLVYFESERAIVARGGSACRLADMDMA